MPDRLDERTTASTEEKHVAGERITAKTLLHLQRQAPHATAHIRVPCRKPNPNPACNRDHRNARKVAVTRFADAVTPTLTRVPSGSTTLIAAPLSNAALSDEPAGSLTTTAGVNSVPPLLADSDCWRHL